MPVRFYAALEVHQPAIRPEKAGAKMRLLSFGRRTAGSVP
ncbi:hypothetical protein B4099_1646 [Heyndrickxia coagulans]|uniref:Uncharacterized protein n=1 Tax=Heyndrickxia coagulans TaxID=1398 RepID=A0A150KI49_HEYCO|nr:hypothetical protein B4099_1646 [Heyndrickxia coagulans]